ncbi:MAG TPA: MFS transporter [Candidatus Sulfotelmatobacter sp.]|jgi:FSR family fosmidomycin resistance protein-like MFS transporter|nr:MFS transporter [Candidatus Sulfotelmatobacter sp.]
MKFLIKSVLQTHSTQFILLNILHILNDGYGASILLLLPFIAKDMYLNLTQVGFLGTLFNSMSILLALPAGYIAMKIGGIKTLILGIFVYALGFLITGIAPSYWLLFFTFLIGGMGVGVFHPIGFALIAKWSTKETRGRQMGNFTAVGDVGKIGISAALTFTIVYISWRYTAILFATIAILIGIVIYYISIAKAEYGQTKQKNIVKISLKEIITHKKFLFTTTAAFFDTFASSSLFIFLPFLLLKRGITPALLGSFAAAFFIGNFVGKTSLGRFVDRFGNATVFMTAELLMAIFILLLANSSNLLLIVVCSIILGIFTKGTSPVIQTMVSDSADHHGYFEKTFAANALVTSIAATLAPVILGFIADKLGIISAFTAMAFAAIVATLPAFAFHKYRTIEKKS